MEEKFNTLNFDRIKSYAMIGLKSESKIEALTTELANTKLELLTVINERDKAIELHTKYKSQLDQLKQNSLDFRFHANEFFNKIFSIFNAMDPQLENPEECVTKINLDLLESQKSMDSKDSLNCIKCENSGDESKSQLTIDECVANQSASDRINRRLTVKPLKRLVYSNRYSENSKSKNQRKKPEKPLNLVLDEHFDMRYSLFTCMLCNDKEHTFQKKSAINKHFRIHYNGIGV